MSSGRELAGVAPLPLATAVHSWLQKSTSMETRSNYQRDLQQFLQFVGLDASQLPEIRPHHVAAWRDDLLQRGCGNSTVVRKLSVLRSLFRYLQTYGYLGANPAHRDFVSAPAVPRDGKTVSLTPEECRILLDGYAGHTPEEVRNRAMLAVLAYTGCRVGEITQLRVNSLLNSGGHRLLEIYGKGGKERRVPLHPEAYERLEQWLICSGIAGDGTGPLFRPVSTARGGGSDGFLRKPLTRRAVQKMMERSLRKLGLNPQASTHSLRVTAITTGRERGSDLIDLQDFAGHADPRTTLTYVRNRNRLNQSPSYLLKY
ncbi:MAG: tyrosine-type recombinase/integrase [Zavarzinella sp.]